MENETTEDALIEGGQGRSAEELQIDAKYLTVLVIGAFVLGMALGLAAMLK